MGFEPTNITGLPHRISWGCLLRLVRHASTGLLLGNNLYSMDWLKGKLRGKPIFFIGTSMVSQWIFPETNPLLYGSRLGSHWCWFVMISLSFCWWSKKYIGCQLPVENNHAYIHLPCMIIHVWKMKTHRLQKGFHIVLICVYMSIYVYIQKVQIYDMIRPFRILYINIHIYIYTYSTCTYTFVLYLQTCTSMYVCIYIYTYSTCTYTFVLYLQTCTSMYVCIYIYISMNTYNQQCRITKFRNPQITWMGTPSWLRFVKFMFGTPMFGHTHRLPISSYPSFCWLTSDVLFLTYVYVYIYIYIQVYMCIYIYIGVYICIYIYIHTYIYIHIYIYTYIYIYTGIIFFRFKSPTELIFVFGL